MTVNSIQIREDLLPRCIQMGRIVVKEEAKRLGVTTSEINCALDYDLRFCRVAGDGCWDWKAYIYKTRANSPGRHKRTLL